MNMWVLSCALVTINLTLELIFTYLQFKMTTLDPFNCWNYYTFPCLLILTNNDQDGPAIRRHLILLLSVFLLPLLAIFLSPTAFLWNSHKKYKIRIQKWRIDEYVEICYPNKKMN